MCWGGGGAGALAERTWAGAGGSPTVVGLEGSWRWGRGWRTGTGLGSTARTIFKLGTDVSHS